MKRMKDMKKTQADFMMFMSFRVKKGGLALSCQQP